MSSTATVPCIFEVERNLVSLVWISSFLGALLAGFTNINITDRLGFGFVSPNTCFLDAGHSLLVLKAAPMGAVLQSVSYALLASGWPFGFFLAAFALNGYGLTVQVSASSYIV